MILYKWNEVTSNMIKNLRAGLQAGQQGKCSLILAGGRDFSFLHSIPTTFAAQLASYSVCVADSFLMDKAANMTLTTPLSLAPRLIM